MMVHAFSDNAHNYLSLASLRSETLESTYADAKVTLFQAPSSVRSMFYRMLVNLSWPVLVRHHADDIKDQVLLTQLIDRPLSSANFPFSFN